MHVEQLFVETLIDIDRKLAEQSERIRSAEDRRFAAAHPDGRKAAG